MDGLYALVLATSLLLGYTSAAKNTDVITFSKYLSSFCHKELDFGRFSQMFNSNSPPSATRRIDGNAEVKHLADKIGDNINAVAKVVSESSRALEASYRMSTNSTGYRFLDCCSFPNGTFSQRFKQLANVTEMCTSYFGKRASNRLHASLATNFSNYLNQHNGLTFQYAGDIYGMYYQYPAAKKDCAGGSGQSKNDFRFKNWYVNTASPKKKNIVVVIDQSGTMSTFIDKSYQVTRLDAAKSAARTVMDTLSSKDYVGLVSFNEDVHSPRGCFKHQIAQANNQNKNTFDNFVSKLQPNYGTLYTNAFKQAFDMMSSAKKNQPDQFEDSLDAILLLTDGDPTDPDIKTIRKVISDGNSKMNSSVRVFFYGIGSSVGRSTSFGDLLSFADQNNQKLNYSYYNRTAAINATVTSTPWSGISSPVGPVGHFQTIKDKDVSKLREIMGNYYLHYPQTVSQDHSFTVPFVDKDYGLMVTVSKPFYDASNKLLGVAAADAMFDSLFDRITYYQRGQYSYAFLADKEGKVLSHPNFARPSKVKSDVEFVSINLAEPSLTNNTINKIKCGKTGNQSSEVMLSISRGISQQDGSFKIKLNATYFYQPVTGFEDHYRVVTVLFEGDDEVDIGTKPNLSNQSSPSSAPAGSQYHRIDLKIKDLNKKNSVCLSAAGLLTKIDGPTIKLAPSAFVDPKDYLIRNETVNHLRLIESLLRGNTSINNLILNQTLQDAFLSESFDKLVATRGRTSVSQSKFLATKTGLFRICPGMMSDKNFDGSLQPWYKQAALFQDRYVFTRAGYSPTGDLSLLTISRALHTHKKQMVGAVGVDVHTSVLKGFIQTMLPDCSTRIWICYLIDHSGYVITEPPLISPNSGRLKHTHMSQVVSSYIITDIIDRHSIIKVKWCRELQSTKKSRMFYDISSKYDEVTSYPGSPACMRYKLISVNGTNLHIMVVSSGSCSLSLNTNKQSCQCSSSCKVCSVNNTSTICQCPCSCSAGVDACTNRYDATFPPLPCPAPWVPIKNITQSNIIRNAQKCTKPCHQRLNETTCLSNPVCKWCNGTSTRPVCLKSCPTVAGSITTTQLPVTTSLSQTTESFPSISSIDSTLTASLVQTTGYTTSSSPSIRSIHSTLTSALANPSSSQSPNLASTTAVTLGSAGSSLTRGVSGTALSFTTTIQGKQSSTSSGSKTSYKSQIRSRKPITNSMQGYTTPSSISSTPNSISTNISPHCVVPSNKSPIIVYMDKIPSTPCPESELNFCLKYCTPPIPPSEPCKQVKEADNSDNNLALGLGIPLAGLAGMAAAGLIGWLLKKKKPLTPEPPQKITPVDSFVPNIYRASMGDELIPATGLRGVQLDEWNSNGQALFGRMTNITKNDN